MTSDARILAAIASTLARNPQVSIGGVSLRCDAGLLLLEGELPSLAAKRRILARAARVQGIFGIIDRLRVRPVRRMSDGELAQRLGWALLGEGAFADHVLCGGTAAKLPQLLRCPELARGIIAFTAQDGLITLDGDVSGLLDKCLAGLLAWWVPGTRDVVNRLSLKHPEHDFGAVTAAAIRLALDKGPGDSAEGIRVGARHGVVWLSGRVPDEAARNRAEIRSWQVFGVERLVNRIGIDREPCRAMGKH